LVWQGFKPKITFFFSIIRKGKEGKFHIRKVIPKFEILGDIPLELP